jgi:fructuronate reductase
VLCCDNLPANGETVRNLMLQFARLAGGDLAEFIGSEVAFPSTMVDRIVPATTDADRERVSETLGVEDFWPVMTEPFLQWVVEENFPAGRPRWEKFGVTMVKDVGPFEDMKLRLLNGAHSAIAYLGLLTGHPTVADSFGDPRIRGFVERYWREVIPTLPRDAGLDTDAYTAALTERFSNPALRHRTSQIGTDGSQKLPQRIIASARLRLKAGLPITNLMLVAAAWIAACRGRGRSLPAGPFTDPLDAKLAEIFAATDEPAELVRAVFAAAGFSGEGGEAMEAVATRHLTTILEKGAAEAISATAKERA